MADTKKKMVIVGDSMIGKSCLLKVFSKNPFPEEDSYQATLHDNDTTTSITIKKHRTCYRFWPCEKLYSCEETIEVEFTLWDTGGCDSLDRLRPISYPDVDVVLICFAIDSVNSFHSVTDKWVPEVKHFCPNVPFLIVGTKKDVRQEREYYRRLSRKKLQPILYDDIQNVVKETNAYAYIECSAKTGHNVTEVFEAACRAALGLKKRPSLKSRFICYLLDTE